MKNLLTITILYLLLTMSQAWSLPPCEGNVWNNCYGIWTFDDGGKYVGEWKDSKQNGKGTSTNTAGFKYVGEHKDGKIHGQGTLFFPDGRVWDGQFSNGGEWAGGEQYATGEVPPDVLAKSGALGVMVNTVTDDIAISSDLEKTMGALVIQITPGSPAEKSGIQAGDIIIKYGEKEIDESLTLIKIISEIDKYKSTQVEVWRNGGPTILQIVLIPTEEDSPDVIAETAKTESRVKNNNNKQTCSGSPQTDGFLKNWNNCWGTYISTVDQALGNGQKNAYMASDSKQEGEWQNNMPNGQGTATWANGDKYVGEFKDDTQNGQGTYTYASGDKYVGEYKDGKWHGQGTATWADGEKYVGEFKDGSKTGQGTYTYADGEVWQGQWKNDVWVSGKKYAAGEYNPAAAEGKSGSDTCLDNEIWDNCVGSYTDENGHSYTGEWKNNFPHGKGTYAYANGAKYVGEVKDGKMDGQGTLTYREADGGKYVGQFKVSTKYTSAKYVGELKDAYTEADGGKYVGEFKDDELNGQGTMFFADGRLWFGQFSDGRWVEGQKFAAGAGDSVIDLIKAGTDVCLKTDEVWENCVASRTEEDGNIYTGEWKNNKHDGKGTYSLKDGRKYVGEFKDGKKDGQGTFTWTGKWSGQKYVGEWKDNNYHGQGTMTYISGDKYLGEWKDSNRNGQGTYTFSNGTQYVGEWKDGKEHGEAVKTFADGRVWIGIFRDGYWVSGRQHAAGEVSLDVVDNETSETEASKDGLCLSSAKVWNGCVGKMSSEDGVYNGEWKNNLPHGKGTYDYANGAKYVGEFKDGKSHGQGTLTDTEGGKYVGEFKNNFTHGKGTYVYASGTKYVGEYKDGKIEGKGTAIWSDGRKYVGEWKNELFHGKGTYTRTNSDEYVGEFKDGKMDGQGTFTYENGGKYVGEWDNGLEDGKGTLTLADGTKKTGDFFNGRFIGDGYPLKIKGIALGDKTAPCSPAEYTYSDPLFNKPIRSALECYSGNSKDEINIIFSLDGSSIVRVKRKQYLDQSDPEPEEILEAAVGFYGTPSEREEGNWLALYDNAHSIDHDGARAIISMNEDGIGLVIKGYICADGNYGTKNCEGLGIYVIEYDLVDVDMYNKQVEDGKLKMEKIQKEKISDQEF